MGFRDDATIASLPYPSTLAAMASISTLMPARGKRPTTNSVAGGLWSPIITAHFQIILDDIGIGHKHTELHHILERHVGRTQDGADPLENHMDLFFGGVGDGAIQPRTNLTITIERPRIGRHLGRVARVIGMGTDLIVEGMYF